MPALTIGRLASLGGVRVDTVRFYERKGLLPTPSRSHAGYRTYRPEHVDRLKFIRKAKALGFTLDQIAELLKLETGEGNTVVIRQLAASRVDALDQTIRELSALRDVLRTYADRETSGEDLIRALLYPRSR